jgi:hypothetical protein
MVWLRLGRRERIGEPFWGDRANGEIQKNAAQPTPNSAERNLTPHPPNDAPMGPVNLGSHKPCRGVNILTVWAAGKLRLGNV